MRSHGSRKKKGLSLLFHKYVSNSPNPGAPSLMWWCPDQEALHSLLDWVASLWNWALAWYMDDRLLIVFKCDKICSWEAISPFKSVLELCLKVFDTSNRWWCGIKLYWLYYNPILASVYGLMLHWQLGWLGHTTIFIDIFVRWRLLFNSMILRAALLGRPNIAGPETLMMYHFMCVWRESLCGPDSGLYSICPSRAPSRRMSIPL